MARDPSSRIASKKHLARLERERRQTVAITYGAIVVIVAVIALIIYGILNQTILLARRPVAKLGDHSR